MPSTPPKEVIDERSKDSAVRDRAMYGITRPRLVVFRPRVPNGSAVLVMPGGGYRWVVVDKEGYEIGRWLAERGYTVFVLFYRLPGEGWAAGPDVALSDAQRAMQAHLLERLEEYKKLEAEGPERIRRNLEALDAMLTPLQQSKYRVLEADVEQRMRALAARAREARPRREP